MTRRSRRASKHGFGRHLRLPLVLLLGFTALQYLATGTVSWPGDLAGAAADYASRPDAAWRRAAERVDVLGAAKDGEPLPVFDLQGRVVRVADGDTVSLLDADNRQHKIRLYGVDTPERDQPFGDAARRALDDLVNGRTVGAVVVDTDAYDRKVATLYRGDVNINHALVAGGFAWWYRYYAPHSRDLEAAEAEARQARRGLWAQANPIPPWDWRRGRRGTAR